MNPTHNPTLVRILDQLNTISSQRYTIDDKLCAYSYQRGILLAILTELSDRDSDNYYRIIRTLNRIEERNRILNNSQ